ncbi:MAG: hypothetical protein ACREMQ_08720, partial [Longimicrobiales bacterium]
ASTAIGQDASTAVGQEVADELLAQPTEALAPRSRRRGCGAPVVDLAMGNRLGSMRHFPPNVRIRKTSPLTSIRGPVRALILVRAFDLGLLVGADWT